MQEFLSGQHQWLFVLYLFQSFFPLISYIAVPLSSFTLDTNSVPFKLSLGQTCSLSPYCAPGELIFRYYFFK